MIQYLNIFKGIIYEKAILKYIERATKPIHDDQT